VCVRAVDVFGFEAEAAGDRGGPHMKTAQDDPLALAAGADGQ
jgi:hypothetical protein